MAASITGFWNRPHEAAIHSAQSLQNAQAAESSSDSGAADSAGISANDFLTLLVTEMQNQDPTADTDPNEYINQLVQVNSLEQLISINQTLTQDSASTTGGAGSAPSQKPDLVSHEGPTQATSIPSASPTPAAPGSAMVVQSVPGNLAIPPTSAAAQRIAQALGGPINRQ